MVFHFFRHLFAVFDHFSDRTSDPPKVEGGSKKFAKKLMKKVKKSCSASDQMSPSKVVRALFKKSFHFFRGDDDFFAGTRDIVIYLSNFFSGKPFFGVGKSFFTWKGGF